VAISALTRRGFAAGAVAIAAGMQRSVAAASPIRHIVVILRENHSFDNYFGDFPGANGRTLDGPCTDTQPDPPHRRADALSGPTSLRKDDTRPGACHYDASMLPQYRGWAHRFVLCDNYFAELLAPSVPNYFALMGAIPAVLENPKGNVRGRFTEHSLIDRLNDKGVTWRNYDGGIPLVTMFRSAVESGNIVPIARFAVDAASGQLPAVSWVTPSLADSEHPPYSVRRGEAWTATQVNAVMHGPAWQRTAIFIVWDEWGGFDDHVRPPVVEQHGLFPEPVRYGYRVPCIVLSPHAKRGVVSHTLYSHASIVRTICRLFDLPSANDADARANDMLDCFNIWR